MSKSSLLTSHLSWKTSKNDVRGTNDDVQLLPLLIIPGIMSSGLEVRKSNVDDKHVGERVWFNPIALGKGKIRRGKNFTAKESKTNVYGDPDADADGDTPADATSQQPQSESESQEKEDKEEICLDSDSDSDESESEGSRDDEEKDELQKELDCKSAWLQHMSLLSDMCTEREGNEIRPIPGLGGVDFLMEIANITIEASYVFGPIIKLLNNIGYVEGLNLDACPYDWRVPPSVLEERDGYFTQTMKRIERMYTENDETPVVLLCHSMGGKTGHYLLNFVLERLGAVAGREWIDQHIHTYMPVGAVHIGCPKLVATAFSGSFNPILDPILSLEERLVFSRSLGSGVWLMPTTLPSMERNAPPTVLCKREGKLTIEIIATQENPLGDVRTLVTNKHGTRTVSNIKIKVAYGDKKIHHDDRVKIKSGKAIPTAPPTHHTNSHEDGSNNEEDETNSNHTNPQYFYFPGPKFIFPTPASLLEGGEKNPLKPIRFTICERGEIRAYRLERENKVWEGILKIDYNQQINLLADQVAKKAGRYGINLATSPLIDNIDVEKLVQAGEKGLTITVPIVARTDMTLLGMVPKKDHRSIDLTFNIKWEPPPSNQDDDPTNPIAMVPGEIVSENSKDGSSSSLSSSHFAPIPGILSTKPGDQASEYIPLSGQAMLKEEGLEDSFVALARNRYSPAKDPVGPRDRSSYERPPVQRIYAIYGTNLKTPVSAICKRVAAYHEDETPMELLARPRFEVDTETRLGGPDASERNSGTEDVGGTSRSGHKLEDGILYEHAGTPQVDLLTGEVVHRSGDGSVPYYCLQQSQVWANELRNDPLLKDTIKIEELEGAQHRAILSDDRFHNLLVEYLTGKTEI